MVESSRPDPAAPVADWRDDPASIEYEGNSGMGSDSPICTAALLRHAARQGCGTHPQLLMVRLARGPMWSAEFRAD